MSAAAISWSWACRCWSWACGSCAAWPRPRLTLAGLATGLFAGGVAATVYGLHCAENTFTFVALWYSLGVLSLAALGAAVGRWALRW
ncbi:NrsF family protein [Caulobacter sp. UC70_42]|uniref:NrsF family protein n=1 Tax=Caulobacter sp. UC70_42 TaxID=3374551 RepID=UPI003757474A